MKGTTAEILLYDEISFFGISAKRFLDELASVDAKKIDLRVNCPGGEVFEGVSIYNALRRSKAKVTAWVDSLCASAASFIVQAADEIIMCEGSQMMIHDAWGLTMGNAAEVRAYADLLDRLSDGSAEIFATRAGGSVAEWRAAMAVETWYSATEAVKAGLADRADRAKPSSAIEKHDLSIFNFAGRVNAPAPPVRIPAAPDLSDLSAAFKEAFAR